MDWEGKKRKKDKIQRKNVDTWKTEYAGNRNFVGLKHNCLL